MPLNFDIDTKPETDFKLDFGDKQPLTEKIATNPIVSKGLDFASKIMTLPEWEELKKNELSVIKSIPSALVALTKPFNLITPEEKQSISNVGVGVLKQIGRIPEGVKAGIGAAIDKKAPAIIIQKSIEGFLKPYEVPTLTSKIPFQEWEQGNWTHLIPRAVAEGVEHFLTYRIAYGQPITVATEKIKSLLGRKIGRDIVKRLEPVLRPQIGKKGMEAVIKASEESAKNIPLKNIISTLRKIAKAPYIRPKTAGLLPGGRIRPAWMGSEIGQAKIPKIKPSILPKGKVKSTIRQTTGQYIPKEPTITEAAALTQALKKEAKGAKIGKREGKQIIKLIDKIKKSPIEGMNYEEKVIIEELKQELKTIRTKEGLVNLYNRIQQLKQIGKQKYIETKQAEDAKFELDKEVLLKSIKPPIKEQWIIGIQAEKPSRLIQAYKGARAITLRPARIFDALDGGQNFKGANSKYFIDRANDTEDIKLKAIDQRRMNMQKAMEQIGINSADLMKSREVAGKNFTVDEMISIYVAAQNREKALATVYGNKIPYSLMRQVILQMTPQEKAMAEAIKTDYQTNYPRLRKALIDYTNGKVDLGRVQNYTPIRRTMQGYIPTEEELAREVLERVNLRKAYAERGFTKERLKNIPKEYQQPIRLGEFGLWYEQMEKQEHFIAYGKLTKEFQRMVNNREFAQAVRDKLGEPYYKTIQNWVNRIGNPNIYKAYTQLDKTVSVLRQNAALAYLGFNLLTMGKQLPSFFLFMEDVGIAPLLSAIHDLSTNYTENMKLIHELAPQMKFRAIERELEEFKVRYPERYRRVLNKIGLIAMRGIREMDKFVTHSGWLAIYNTGIKEGLAQAEAAREATKAVLRTQPAAHAKDIAELYATNEFVNMFIQFTNQLNQYYNILTYDIPTQAKTGRYKDMIKTGTGVALGAIAIALITKGRFPTSNKEAIEMGLEQFLSYIPFFGRGLAGMMKGFDFISIPAFAGIQRGGQAIMSLQKGKLEKALERALETSAAIGGIPGFAQLRRTLKGIRAISKGQAGAGALLYGRPKEKKGEEFKLKSYKTKKGGRQYKLKF